MPRAGGRGRRPDRARRRRTARRGRPTGRTRRHRDFAWRPVGRGRVLEEAVDRLVGAIHVAVPLVPRDVDARLTIREVFCQRLLRAQELGDQPRLRGVAGQLRPARGGEADEVQPLEPDRERHPGHARRDAAAPLQQRRVQERQRDLEAGGEHDRVERARARPRDRRGCGMRPSAGRGPAKLPGYSGTNGSQRWPLATITPRAPP
jgi:hypothetical protein